VCHVARRFGSRARASAQKHARRFSQIFTFYKQLSKCLVPPIRAGGRQHGFAVRRNADAAWYYADPKSAAENIRGRVAFWRGVEVTS
jgi:hypothetical protein